MPATGGRLPRRWRGNYTQTLGCGFISKTSRRQQKDADGYEIEHHGHHSLSRRRRQSSGASTPRWRLLFFRGSLGGKLVDLIKAVVIVAHQFEFLDEVTHRLFLLHLFIQKPFQERKGRIILLRRRQFV